MSFAAPRAVLILPLPILLLRLLPAKAAASGALTLPPAVAKAFRPTDAAPARRHAWSVVLFLAWAADVAALAGPREERILDVVPASGRDIVLALDLSGSMEREGFGLGGAQVSRLAAVQNVGSRFVRGRTGDRVGLVVFGDRAYVAASLTHDLAAAVTAETLGVRIHTIALGPADLETAPDARDAVDSETLRRIATAADGETFRVRTTDDLLAVTEAIDRLEPSLADAPPVRAWYDYWPWLAGAALACLGLSLVLHARDAS